MEFVFIFLVGIVIIYRIFLIGKEILKILTDPQFYLASIFLYFYVFIGFRIINLPPTIVAYSDSDLVQILALGLSLKLLILLCYYYYTLIGKYPMLKFPLYFLLLIVSFGAIAFNLYNRTNTDDNYGEFVDPHHVNGYTKANGNHIKSYWRDGDGNTDINLGKNQGGGYFRNK